MISVQVISIGLSPLEMEDAVTKKIENKLESISGIKDINSSSSENIANIFVEMDRGANMYVALQDVNNAIDQIKFNVDIEDIFIKKREFIMPTIGFSLYTSKDMDYLNNFVNKVDDELKSVDGISEISISGMPEKELEILISEDKLLAYNISMDEITQSILRKT